MKLCYNRIRRQGAAEVHALSLRFHRLPITVYVVGYDVAPHPTH